MEIITEKLKVEIDRKSIISDIDIALRNKEFVGLIGPNGSGKSTILKTIYRALKPVRGTIYFDGMDLKKLPLKESARKMGVMRQMSHSTFDFKVLDIVLLGRAPFKKSMELDNTDDYKIAYDALSLVGMGNFAERNFNSLSGGEQQRVMMARVLAGKPQVLLLDELTNHLDVYYQFKLLDLVKSLRVETLAVMHDLNMAARYCDKLYFLLHGEIVVCGKTADVLTEENIYRVFKIKAQIVKDDNIYQVIYQGI